MEAPNMKIIKLALAGLSAVGAALVTAPAPAEAGYYGDSGYGHHRPFVRKVVVHRHFYGGGYGGGYGYHRPFVRRVVYRSHGGFYGHHRGFYGRPHVVRFGGYHRGHRGWGGHHGRWY